MECLKVVLIPALPFAIDAEETEKVPVDKDGDGPARTCRCDDPPSVTSTEGEAVPSCGLRESLLH